MYPIRELIKRSTEYLEKRGVSHARREAEELLASLLNRKRMELYFDYDAPLEEKEVAKYREWIKRKGKKEPLAYILGEVDFLSLKLKVTPATLIPRHETEILADLIVKNLPDTPLEVWDVCTGTGCLGLAIKSQRPSAQVRLSDISKEALEIARSNAELNHLEVECLEGDLLAPFTGMKADVIVCNPPYITPDEYEGLEEEVRSFEPKGALVGGLEFYHRLARDLPLFLNPGAKVFFEIGAGQGEPLMEIFSESHWVQKKCEKDWSGHDRFFFLEYEKNFE
ncbi:MAG: peptide chain release factor N(5)-glutamine methyltransferase [Simkaniaceae bacterium]|jgi:release factor glutamine methyltransferase|nr:MAG: peptide chain release factor N(5)-glutamine methyltransferase [Simkaniaceae bacterium]